MKLVVKKIINVRAYAIPYCNITEEIGVARPVTVHCARSIQKPDADMDDLEKNLSDLSSRF